MPPEEIARIFLLSHMRAYTSLAGHLLGSHPEINGYYEMHLGYASAHDLDTQLQRYCAHAALKPGSRYLFDKLLHNDYPLHLAQLGTDDTRVLITLRPPAPTLKSILALFACKDCNDPYADPAGATAYYLDRVQALADFAQRYPQRYYYFDADLLRSDPARVLAAFTEWLQLGSPLAAHYQTFAKTGVAGAGDSSAAIHAGRVLPEENAYPDIVLDAALLARAQRVYHDCRQQLIDHAAAALIL